MTPLKTSAWEASCGITGIRFRFCLTSSESLGSINKAFSQHCSVKKPR